jgi:lipopolysaccharide/colanic/teichoic acid biosynthesis glycosyltransferase
LRPRLARAADVVVGAIVLVVLLPVMAVLAIAVRASSHGPVLHRDVRLRADGRRVELLAFRTLVDGGETAAHERLRAVIGAEAEPPLTGVGRVLRRTRLEHLPRVLSLVAGTTSLFRR